MDHVLEEMGNNSAHQISKSLEISSPNGPWACHLSQSLGMEGDVVPEKEDLLLSI